jgi:hypothetical protein
MLRKPPQQLKSKRQVLSINTVSQCINMVLSIESVHADQHTPTHTEHQQQVEERISKPNPIFRLGGCGSAAGATRPQRRAASYLASVRIRAFRGA